MNNRSLFSQEENDSQPYSFSEVPPQPVPVAVKFEGASPAVTYTLMGITIAVYLLQLGSQWLLGEDYVALLGLKVNALIIQGQYWRLITPIFLHASLLHIAFNMYALYAFGPNLERHYGHSRFLALYLLSGFAGNVLSFLFSSAPSLGASTAIFGLLGAEGVFLYQHQKLFGSSARAALINIVVIAAINLFIGMTPGIDNWGHLGGLIGGTLFAWFAGPVLKLEGVYPALTLVNERSSREVLVAGSAIGMLFSLLAAAGIILRT